MPLPPPPSLALIITGNPIFFAQIYASSSVLSSGEPGATGMPAFCAAARAAILSPIRRICADVGPIKVIPCLSTISAKSAFSDKKPYPGCMASAPVITAAEIIAGLFKYDSEAFCGPIQTASSAMRTCIAFASAKECTATVLIPISRQARWILKAISPRFAIRIFSNIETSYFFTQSQSMVHRIQSDHRLRPKFL